MNDPKPTTPARWWGARPFQRPAHRWMLGVPLGALLFFVLGIAALGGTQAVIGATGTEQFCAYACHEMTAFVVPSWKQSTHYKNPQGVHASCPDCHIPEPEIAKLALKFREGLNDAWGHLTGVVSTQAKFDAKKAEMARDVWAYMKATDSRECRHCHSAARWDLSAQSRSAQRKHEQMKTTGETCIGCHQGVVHEVPLGAESGT